MSEAKDGVIGAAIEQIGNVMVAATTTPPTPPAPDEMVHGALAQLLGAVYDAGYQAATEVSGQG